MSTNSVANSLIPPKSEIVFLRLARLIACLVLFSVATSPAQTLRLLNQQISSNGAFQFSFQASAGQTYPITMSSDLVNWAPVTNATGIDGSLWIQDSQATNVQRRFFHLGTRVMPITNMVALRPGSFTMGSPASEVGRGANEGPQTVVTISHVFWIGKYEVTQEEYEPVVGNNAASFFKGPKMPVDFATYNDATNYCQKLTAREIAAGRLPAGYVYRLPTEAEWEFASRAGSSTPFGVGTGTALSSTQANFDGNFPAGGAPTGLFRNYSIPGGNFAPNGWGLYDMHGNVWEWCQDYYAATYPGGNVTDPKGPATGTTRVLRGGGFSSVGHGCRSAKRDPRAPTYGNFGLGFRIVLARVP